MTTILPKFRRQIWRNKLTDGQTDGKVHSYKVLETTYMEIKSNAL